MHCAVSDYRDGHVTAHVCGVFGYMFEGKPINYVDLVCTTAWNELLVALGYALR